MEVKLYGDIFLAVNGTMDILILWLTCIIAKRKIPFCRLLIASILMAICPLLALLSPSLRYLYSPLGSIFILSLGVGLAFFPKRIKEYLGLMLIAYMASFTVGGCGMALFFFFGAPPIFGGDVSFRSRLFPLKLLIVLTAMFYCVIKIGHSMFETKLIDRKEYCTAVINQGGKEAVLNTFIDNGNGLKDPYNGYAVLIATFSAIQVFFTKDSREMFFKGILNENEMQEYLLLKETSLSLRLVSFSSLGQDNGLILVFRPKFLSLNHLGREFLNREVMIGVYLGIFNGAYDAIINPELVTGEEQIVKQWVKGDYHERL